MSSEMFREQVERMYDEAMSALIKNTREGDYLTQAQAEFIRAICHYAAAFLEDDGIEDYDDGADKLN